MTSFERKRDPERFRHLEQLFELLLSVDPCAWDDVVADRAVDPRLAVEARRLLLLERSGEPHRYLKHLVSAAHAVLRAEEAPPVEGRNVRPRPGSRGSHRHPPPASSHDHANGDPFNPS